MSFIQIGHATTWQVGPASTYTLPSQVATLVADGDTVAIDAGIYESDVAKWTANNLVLMGIGGLAHLKSNGNAYGGKAIWVIAGDNTVVEQIEFSGCSVPDHNGAGIRQEGHHLTVRHCLFHDNEDGILAGTVNPSTIVIEYTEFGVHGFGDGLSHNVYINNVDSLVFRYNYSHGCKVGHELKSRARVNLILYNRIGNESTGTGSRNIDLPNGGTVYMIGNIIEQGPLSENHNMIGYGLEGLSNPTPHEVYAVNNTLVNNYPGGSFFQFNVQTALFKAYNNIVAGAGNFIGGDQPQAMDTAANIMNTDMAAFGFADATGYDFNIINIASPVIGIATNPGSANGFSLSPTMEYEHPTAAKARCVSGGLDIGAYELCSPSRVNEEQADKLTIYPNPATDFIQIELPNAQQALVEIYALWGKRLFIGPNTGGPIDISSLPNGTYLVKTSQGKQVWLGKIAKHR